MRTHRRHSSTHPPTHSLTHPATQPPTHSLTHSPTHSLTGLVRRTEEASSQLNDEHTQASSQLDDKHAGWASSQLEASELAAALASVAAHGSYRRVHPSHRAEPHEDGSQGGCSAHLTHVDPTHVDPTHLAPGRHLGLCEEWAVGPSQLTDAGPDDAHATSWATMPSVPSHDTDSQEVEARAAEARWAEVRAAEAREAETREAEAREAEARAELEGRLNDFTRTDEQSQHGGPSPHSSLSPPVDSSRCDARGQSALANALSSSSVSSSGTAGAYYLATRRMNPQGAMALRGQTPKAAPHEEAATPAAIPAATNAAPHGATHSHAAKRAAGRPRCRLGALVVHALIGRWLKRQGTSNRLAEAWACWQQAIWKIGAEHSAAALSAALTRASHLSATASHCSADRNALGTLAALTFTVARTAEYREARSSRLVRHVALSRGLEWRGATQLAHALRAWRCVMGMVEVSPRVVERAALTVQHTAMRQRVRALATSVDAAHAAEHAALSQVDEARGALKRERAAWTIQVATVRRRLAHSHADHHSAIAVQRARLEAEVQALQIRLDAATAALNALLEETEQQHAVARQQGEASATKHAVRLASL